MNLRLISKNKYLRIVSFFALAAIFACLLLSYAYVKKEFSYDKFHEKADRLVRISVQLDEDVIDGRLFWTNSSIPPVLNETAEIEELVLIEHIKVGLLEYDGKKHIVNDFYTASPNFFDVFSLKLTDGDKQKVLDNPHKIALSRNYAIKLFGQEGALDKYLGFASRRIAETGFTVSGIFEDFPENSHFHPEVIIAREGVPDYFYGFVYALLADNTTIDHLEQKLTEGFKQHYADKQLVEAHVMPITDIHLHSRVQREMEIPGNIYYIYLIGGVNIILLVVVLFNLWLNSGLIFSYSRRYYRLLRLNGASALKVVSDEMVYAVLLAVSSMFAGGLLAYILRVKLSISADYIEMSEILAGCIVFLLLVCLVCMLPVLIQLPSTVFLNIKQEEKRRNFSDVKYMFIAQYALAMFIVIIALGVSKQINQIRTSQVGGTETNIITLREQPEEVQEKFGLLKTELLKHPEIEMATTAMQLPGSAIRDMIHIKGEEWPDLKQLRVLVVGEDFFPFFGINPVAGRFFDKNPFTYSQEYNVMINHLEKNLSEIDLTEGYILNRQAVNYLGLSTPEEALGHCFELVGHNSLDYIKYGEIKGVTDNFNYTTVFEDTMPLLIMQRTVFQHTILIRLDSNNISEALDVFNKEWNKLFPEYSANYVFLDDIYRNVYHNEFSAGFLVRVFSILCLIIVNLGLITFIAFIIRKRTKEIAIRKVNGATTWNIIYILNTSFFRWIAVAFIIAVPLGYLVMDKWLDNFVLKTSLDWWLFLLAGLFVLIIAFIAVFGQSYWAATRNSADTIKNE